MFICTYINCQKQTCLSQQHDATVKVGRPVQFVFHQRVPNSCLRWSKRLYFVFFGSKVGFVVCLFVKLWYFFGLTKNEMHIQCIYIYYLFEYSLVQSLKVSKHTSFVFCFTSAQFGTRWKHVYIMIYNVFRVHRSVSVYIFIYTHVYNCLLFCSTDSSSRDT